MKQGRQGDVFVERISAIPKGAILKQRSGKIVLAEGEATGHAHTIEGAELYERDGILYLNVSETREVRHQEHSAGTLLPGAYRIKRQCEWGDDDEPRTVAD